MRRLTTHALVITLISLNASIQAGLCHSGSGRMLVAASLSPKSAPTLTEDQKRAAIATLRRKGLALPVAHVDVDKMKGSFYEMRGTEMHEAVDILQPRNTPVFAVEDGTLAKLFTSRFGGLTIYQYDPTKKFVYYYAHLQNYADNLQDGQALKKGQLIGFVGTSGNAPPNTPHLHFSIGVLGKEPKWWQAASVDPYEVFKK